MKEVDEFEAKIKRMEKLKIRTNELGCDKLKSDLNFEKGLEIDRIKRVETTPKKILIQLKINADEFYKCYGLMIQSWKTIWPLF